MPILNGKELSGRVKEACPEAKVLFMSGYTDDILAGHGVLDPGTHLLQKPFSPEGLRAKFREVLDS